MPCAEGAKEAVRVRRRREKKVARGERVARRPWIHQDKCPQP